MFSPRKFGLRLRDYDSNWTGFLSRRNMNSWVIHHPNYWVGQNVRVGFAIPSYRKTWRNFFANPMLWGMEKGYLREIMKTGEAETRNHETALWFLKMSQALFLPSFLPFFPSLLDILLSFSLFLVNTEASVQKPFFRTLQKPLSELLPGKTHTSINILGSHFGEIDILWINSSLWCAKCVPRMQPNTKHGPSLLATHSSVSGQRSFLFVENCDIPPWLHSTNAWDTPQRF